MKVCSFLVVGVLLAGLVADGQKLTRLTDINRSITDGGSTHFTSCIPFNNKLYFVADSNWNNWQQWVTDGTLAGTVPFRSMQLSHYITGRGFTVVGSKMFFLANDSINGNELWVSDSATGSIHIVKDIWPGANSSVGLNNQLIELNGRVLFAANDNVYGNELWASDGTVAGTVMVKDVCSAGNSGPSSFLRLDSQVIFGADSCAGHGDLFITNGSFTGTHLVKQGFKDSYSTPQYLCRFNNGLIFRASIATTGYNLEPWISDGTDAGTHVLKEINPNGGSNPTNFVSYGGKAFFVANDGNNQGFKYTTDGTDTGTHKVYFPLLSEPTLMNGRWYGAGSDGSNGNELWTSDGTASGTSLVKDIYPGGANNSSDPMGFTLFNNRLYFSAVSGIYGRVLWSTDGTDTGTHEVFSSTWANANALGYLGYVTNKFAVLNNALYFAARYDSTGTELWRLDPDSASNLSVGGPQMGRMALTLYPNPANDFINVAGNQNINMLMVYDVAGRLMLTSHGSTADIRQLADGAYGIVAVGGNGVSAHGRFIKLSQ